MAVTIKGQFKDDLNEDNEDVEKTDLYSIHPLLHGSAALDEVADVRSPDY